MTSQRESLLWHGLLAALLALACAGTGAVCPANAKPNVLFLAIDDQNDWIGCLGGHPQVKTPHIDRLAKRGTLFTNAHCQAPLCNPSRASLLTGLRPSTTGVYGLAPGIRGVVALKEHVTLPQTFTRAGYHTYTCGKIYHDGSIPPPARPAEFGTWGPAPGMPRPQKRFVPLPNAHPLMDWGPFPDNEEEQADWKIAAAAIEALKTAPADRPFFIAAGFRLPHVPCFAGPKWFDLYPDDRLVMPPVKEDDRADTPEFSWYLHWKLPEPRLSALRKIDQWRPLVRAYLASVSFMDSQVGRVLDALDATGRSDNTIVVLWSDHGWHLGEKGITGKNTLWERSTRVPLVFAGPGIAKDARCSRPVELLDLFPTLLDLCGFPARPDLEGHSLTAQLKDASAPRAWPAITTHNQGNHAIRTEQWRYIRYADGSEELYDVKADPNEWTNLARDPRHAETKRDLSRWLPKVDRPPVPGSAHRVLTYDPKTGEAIWEGKKLVPAELEK
jgi:arylsulfatase A-like enzyme